MPNHPVQLPPHGVEAPRPPKLLERMRMHLRTRHYSIRTEVFHNKRHPQEMVAAEAEAFLSHLAVERRVSASTQNQAKAAILHGCHNLPVFPPI